MARHRSCACKRQFVPKSANHRSCSRCSKAHRRGRRCEVASCATCARAFARLSAFNDRRSPDVKCAGCGMTYGQFRAGFTFGDARRDFITDDPNRKTGRRRHGRRNGVLGKLREWKLLGWRAHVDQCVDAHERKSA